MRCILIYESMYEVQTHWGWFRLDEGAYRDYLAGKLWITWKPGRQSAPTSDGLTDQALPPHVTQEAVRLRDEASGEDLLLFLQERFPGMEVVIPYKPRMREISIDEMLLSVRSSNGLKRARALSFGRLWNILNMENGLRAVRNLGQKSEKEILQTFISACYSLLTPGEKAVFWQTILDECQRKTSL